MKIISVLLIGMVLGQEIPIEVTKKREASTRPHGKATELINTSEHARAKIDIRIKPTEAKKKIDVSKLLGALVAGLSGKNQKKHDALSTIQIKSVKSSSSPPSSSSSSSPGVLKVMQLMTDLENTKNATLIKAANQILTSELTEETYATKTKQARANIDIGIKHTEEKKKQIDTTKHIPAIATRPHGKATELIKTTEHRKIEKYTTNTKQARAKIDIGIKPTEVKKKQIETEAKKNQIEASVIDKGIEPTEAKKKIDMLKVIGALFAGLSGGHGSGAKQAEDLLGALLDGKNQTNHDALSTIQIKSVKSSSSPPSSSSSSSPGVLKIMELMAALKTTKNATLIKAAYQIIAEAEEKEKNDNGIKRTEAKKKQIEAESKKNQIEAKSKKNQMDTTKHILDIATRLHGKATEQKIFTHRIKPKKNQVTNVLTFKHTQKILKHQMDSIHKRITEVHGATNKQIIATNQIMSGHQTHKSDDNKAKNGAHSNKLMNLHMNLLVVLFVFLFIQ